MAMKASQVLPHVWVVDEAVPQSMLDHVDQAFAAASRGRTTKDLVVEFVQFTLFDFIKTVLRLSMFWPVIGRQREDEYHVRPLTSRSIEFEMDETSRPFFEMIAHCWGLNLEEPFEKFMVSDIWGAGQSAHVDHMKPKPETLNIKPQSLKPSAASHQPQH